MKHFSKLLIVFYIFIVILLLFYCFVFTGNTNHSSYNFTKIFIILGIIGFFSGILIEILVAEKKYGKVLLICSVCIICSEIAFNLFNVMISYDLWLEGGMPEKYTFCIKK